MDAEMDGIVLRLDEQRPAVRVALAVVLAVLVYALGRWLAVAPLQQRAEEVQAEADQTAQQLGVERRRLEGFESPPESLLAEADSLRSRLRRAADSFPGGLRSGLLTAFSTRAEEAGAGSPLFNLRGASSGGGVLRGIRILTIEGDLQGSTRSVASFLEQLARTPMPVTVDSLQLFRQTAENRAILRLRVLAPDEGG